MDVSKPVEVPMLDLLVMCRTMCLYIAAQCLSLLEQFPTTIEQDQQLLQYICSTSTKLHHAPTEANNDDYRAESASIRAEHQQLGITYRLTRKKMLKAIVTDLQSMANLLDPT